jgi:hypothetical protein
MKTEKSMKSLSESNFLTMKSINERIFWSKEKIVEVREKLREVKDIITAKTDDKFYELDYVINHGETEKVLSIMQDPIFKLFWENEIKKRKVLINILLANQPEILKKILEDKFYKFDELYCFTYIKQVLNKTSQDFKNNEQVHAVLFNIVNCDLYDKKLHKLLAWFLANLCNYETFRLLVSKHSEFEEDKAQYNNFENKEDISDYSANSANYNYVITECLKNKLEDLAM